MHSVYLLLCLQAPLQPYSDSHRDIEKQTARLKGGSTGFASQGNREKREEELAARRKGEKKLFQGGPSWCTISMLLY
jgi:hypothetical protein